VTTVNSNGLAGCRIRVVHSRTHKRGQRFLRNLRGVQDEAADDQLSDYRVDDPHIQAHVHGPSPRSLLALDDSQTVLREAAVVSRTDSNPSRHERHVPTISRGFTLGPDGGGCARTICPDLWTRTSDRDWCARNRRW
jgi:hypothetical protein